MKNSTSSTNRSTDEFELADFVEETPAEDLLAAESGLSTDHRQDLEQFSGIDREVIAERRYRTVRANKDGALDRMGFPYGGGVKLPALALPIHGVDGPTGLAMVRSVEPKPGRKYEWPHGVSNMLDVHPRSRPHLGDPDVDLWITEGIKKADSLVSRGACAISVNGVYGWRHTNDKSGKTVVPCFEKIALNGRVVYIGYDSDVMTNPKVAGALRRLAYYLKGQGADVRFVYLPAEEGQKVGVDDYFANGGTLDELREMAEDKLRNDDPRFPMNVTELDLEVAAAELWGVVDEVQDKVQLYRTDEGLVELARDADNRLKIEPVNATRKGTILAESVRFYGYKKVPVSRIDAAGNQVIDRDGFPAKKLVPVQVPKMPPKALTEAMVETPGPNVPWLVRIMRAPYLGASWRIVTEAGYHLEDRTYLDPDITVTVPDAPTNHQVAAAVALVDEMICDFPLVDQVGDRAAVFALMVDSFVRPVTGPGAIYVSSAPTPGSGKGLLVESALHPAIGTLIWNAPPPRKEEWSKIIVTAIRDGDMVFGVDNVAHTVDSESLAALVTARGFKGRVLGKSESVTARSNMIVALTGNNPTFGDDVSRRVLRIRLLPDIEDPSTRTRFVHPDLESWVEEHRADLMTAVLTLVANWLAKGRPLGRTTLGSFERWCRIVGGVLEAAEVEGFLTTAEVRLKTSTPDSDAFRALAQMWWAGHNEAEVFAAELLWIAEEVGLPLKDEEPRKRTIALGNIISRRCDQVFNVLVGNGDKTLPVRVTRAGRKWQLVPVKAGPQGSEDGEDAACAASSEEAALEAARDFRDVEGQNAASSSLCAPKLLLENHEKNCLEEELLEFSQSDAPRALLPRGCTGTASEREFRDVGHEKGANYDVQPPVQPPAHEAAQAAQGPYFASPNGVDDEVTVTAWVDDESADDEDGNDESDKE